MLKRMIKKLTIAFPILAICLTFAVGSASAEDSVATKLQYTTWKGKFHTLLGDGNIIIRFRDKPKDREEINYYHVVAKDTIIGDLLAKDAACNWTPRTLVVIAPEDANSPATGQIKRPYCGKTQEEEQSLNQSKKPQDPIEVSAITLDQGAGTLYINALPKVDVWNLGPLPLDPLELFKMATKGEFSLNLDPTADNSH